MRNVNTVLFIVIAVVSTAFICVAAFCGFSRKDNSLNRIEIIGTYDEVAPNKIIVEGRISKDIPARNKIMFYLNQIEINSWINGEQVYQSGRNGNARWDYFVTDGVSTEDDIRIEFKSLYGSLSMKEVENSLDKTYYGNRYDLLKEMFRENIVRIVLCLHIFLLGLIIIIVTIIYKILKEPVLKENIPCSLMLIVGGLCLLSNQEYMTLLIDNYVLSNNVSKSFQMAFCAFLNMYLSTYIKTEKYKRITQFVMIGWIIVYIASFVTVPVGVFSNKFLIGICAPIAVLFTGIITVLILLEHMKNKMGVVKYIVVSTIILCITTVIEIVYFAITKRFLTYLFLASVATFAVAQFTVVIKSINRSVQDGRRATMLEAELTNNQVELMMSKIKPHFVFNALAVIYDLCDREPQTAKKGLEFFTKYLRSNMNAIGVNECIPFDKELMHAKSYLYIEGLRKGDKLSVEYDLKTTDFNIPPLALETIVENAVRHGIALKREGGTVRISTYENENEYVVVVEDDGVGFDVNEKQSDDSRSHIGIENTISRMKRMCNGDVNIYSEIGKGTKVELIIPK